jgi:membrane protein
MRAKMSEIRVWPLLKQTAAEWSEDKASKMAASLAYYTATCIAPLAVAAVGIATLVLRNKFKPAELQSTLAGLTNDSVGKVLSDTINNPEAGHAGLLATIFGIVVALFSASSLFGELQDSLNTIWEVTPKPNRGIKGVIQDRFLTLSMVAGIAFLLLVSTILTAVVTGVSGAVVGRFTGGVISSGVAKWILFCVTFVLNTGIVTVLFAGMFKLLPDVIVAWRDVWLGAFLTSVMFQVGKLGLSWYLTRFSPGSAFGAAGTLVVMLVWVYYSSYFLFFGAEFTQVYANQYGSRVVPASNAEPLTEDMRRQAGMPHAPDSSSNPANLAPTVSTPPRPRPVGPLLRSTPGMRTRGTALMAVAPIAVGVVLSRFAFRRYRAGQVHAAEIAAGWHNAGRQWSKLAKLLVSTAGDRYAMTHGPAGRTGPSWAELADRAQS